MQCCAYCKTAEVLTVVTFDIEHIIPRIQGGSSEFENLCLACPICNRYKSIRVAGITDEGIESSLFPPQRDRWPDYFAWSVNATFIAGLTDIGKATINLLRMNWAQLVETRSQWVSAGKHPPY